MRGMYYRSDTRVPYDPDQMFANGFSKRKPLKYDAPKLRYIAGPDAAPDIRPTSAVCVSRDFHAAPLFPVSDLKTDTWVYVLDLDVADMTNTQQSQYEYVSSISKLGVAEALWPMFGQERAVNSVTPGDIVGAVYVQRKFNADDVFNGGTFLPLAYEPNPSYAGPDGTATQAADLIKRLVADSKWLPMPTQSQGIVKIEKPTT